jgi:L-lactate dehydrogenase
VCLSVPSVVNRAGVQRVLPVPLSGEERDGLHRSARTVRAVLDKLAL